MIYHRVPGGEHAKYVKVTQKGLNELREYKKAPEPESVEPTIQPEKQPKRELKIIRPADQVKEKGKKTVIIKRHLKH